MGGQVAAKPPLAARAEAVTVAAARPPLPLNLSEGIGKDPEAADAAGLMPDHRKVPSTQSRAVMPHTALRLRVGRAGRAWPIGPLSLS
jgi:hypothetical protein